MTHATTTCAGGTELAAQPAAVESFEAVYRAHAKMVLRCLRGFVDAAAVDDCAQEVFVVAARRLSSRTGQTSTRAWLVGIARNVARHYQRTRQRAIRRDQLAAPPNPLPCPEHETGLQSDMRFVERFISGLADHYREVFVLGQVEGLTGPEISAALGLKPNTVYTRLARVRQAFAAALEKRESEERS